MNMPPAPRVNFNERSNIPIGSRTWNAYAFPKVSRVANEFNSEIPRDIVWNARFTGLLKARKELHGAMLYPKPCNVQKNDFEDSEPRRTENASNSWSYIVICAARFSLIVCDAA